MMATSISEPAISPIRAVMLDYGEVLCFLPTPDAIARMARIFRIDPGAFLSIYTQSRGPYDRGDLSPEEYWHAFASQAGVTLDGDLIEELRRWDVEMWSRTNDPMILWLESLHAAGLKTAILSNMPSDMVEHLRRNSPWMKNFDHQIFSAEVRRIKPEPAIYEHSLHALKLPLQRFCSSTTVMQISNKLARTECEAFDSSVHQLRDDLHALGFHVLPPRINSHHNL